MENAWDNLFGRSSESRNVRDDVIHRYISSGRAYHNLEHIAACLRLLEEHKQLASRQTEVEVALWYHDIVYDPKRKDNEEKSAALARDHLLRLGVKSTGFLIDVEHLIMATRHTGIPKTPDCALVADIDLAILAASPRGYDWYARAIRKEYSFVKRDAFRKGRADVLRSFLKRSSIYTTPTFRHRYEHIARANLEREIESLTP
jgi:predicted metal-dependent HD superfamily phosphohydrolase